MPPTDIDETLADVDRFAGALPGRGDGRADGFPGLCRRRCDRGDGAAEDFQNVASFHVGALYVSIRSLISFFDVSKVRPENVFCQPRFNCPIGMKALGPAPADLFETIEWVKRCRSAIVLAPR
jgi:hypothetical protein